MAGLGFNLVATRGTAQALREQGLQVERVHKVNEGRPNTLDLIKSNALNLIINTPLGRASRFDEKAIRRAAVQHGVSCITTISAAAAAVNGIRAQRERGIQVISLQELEQSQQSSATGRLTAVAVSSREQHADESDAAKHASSGPLMLNQ